MNFGRLQQKLLMAIYRKYGITLSVDKRACYSEMYQKVYYRYCVNRHEGRQKRELYSSSRIVDVVRYLGLTYQEGIHDD